MDTPIGAGHEGSGSETGRTQESFWEIGEESSDAKGAEPCWQDTEGTPEKGSSLLENGPELAF